MFFALKGSNFDGNTFSKDAIKLGAKYVIIDNKDYALGSNTILVNDVLETLQKLATFHRLFLGTEILALTGSNGKTTTKELINAVLSKKFKTMATAGNLNNHIGVPLTLLSLTKETEIGIVEMGANHQKEIEFLCNIALPDCGYITNFGKAHLEGFGGVEGVIKGKSEMYTHLINTNKTIFINNDDPIQIEKTKHANTVTFGTKQESDNTVIKLKSSEPYVSVVFNNISINSQLIGEYNFSNISAAVAIGIYFGVTINAIKDAIENYIPSNNRSQILKKGTNKIILDAYNANPTSMRAALTNINNQKENKKILFLGDMFELGKDSKLEHEGIVKLTQDMNLENCYYIGENFFSIKDNDYPGEFFKSFEDFKNHVMTLQFDDSLILIKGSRGMALERILDILH